MHSGKFKAFFVHLCISGFVVGCAAAAVFVWYPGTYLQLAGGGNMLLLLMAVDTVLGPCLTLLVYHRRKSSTELFVDFSVIAVLQTTALAYGLWTAYVARPVYVVFEYQRMTLVSAVDVAKEDLLRAPTELRNLPKTGPKLLSLRDFTSATEQYDSVMRAIAGQSQAAQPELWQPYEAARSRVLGVAKPLRELKLASGSASRLAELVAKSGVDKDQLKYLPLLGRKGDWIVLIDPISAEPRGMMAVEPG